MMSFFSIQPVGDDQEQDKLIDETRNTNRQSNIFGQPAASTPTSPHYLSHARSDTNLIINISSPPQNKTSNDNTNKSLLSTKRSHSMFTATKCSPS